MGRLVNTTRTRHATTSLALALLATLLTGLLGGCGSPGARTEEPMDPRAELASRPSSEEVVARYEEMQQRIRDRIDAEIGPFGWYRVRDTSFSTCGFDFPHDLGGQTVGIGPWGFDSGIPDADWPRAQQAITEITAEYGFTELGVQINAPGRHKTTGADPVLGAYYEFGTEINTTMQITTGCHRPATDPDQ